MKKRKRNYSGIHGRSKARIISSILVFAFFTGLCPGLSGSYFIQASELEYSNSITAGSSETSPSGEEIDYILGRPMTEEERQAQHDMIPELIYTDIPFDPVESSDLAELSPYTAVTASLPSSYDSRDYNLITPVKDQGNWGTCWAFGAISGIETAAIKADLCSNTVDYSENHLAYFYYNRQNDPLGNTSGDKSSIGESGYTYLNRGGNLWLVAFMLSQWSGPVTETSCPYSAYSTPKVPAADTCYDHEAIVSDVEWFNYDVDTMKAAIMNYGSVSSSYYHADSNYNYNTGAYCSSGATGSNHAITIVGWDDDYAVANFNSSCAPSSPGAWIVKNSWSSSFGDSGYIYISYENDIIECNLVYTVASQSEEDSYDNNYYYDGGTGMTYCSLDPGEKVGNVFQAEGNGAYGQESLEAVQVAIATDSFAYEIQIYTNFSAMSNPSDGAPALSIPLTGTLTGTGYHTVELDTPVILNAGEYYSVVITATSAGDIFIDGDLNYTWVVINTAEAIGQSYCYSYGWYDMYTIFGDEPYCARIHALTDNIITTTKSLSSIAVTHAPDKVSYVEGETFSKTGMIVTAYYTNNTSAAVTSYTVSPSPLTAGTANVTISYTEGGITKTATQAVTVAAKIPTSIVITSSPVKTTYVEGEIFNFAGIAVKAYYNDSTNAVITDSCTYPSDPLAFGTTSVIISYTYNGYTKTASQKIKVTANKTELNSAILSAQGLSVYDYTNASWSTLASALTAAETEAASAVSTPQTVSNALKALNSAADALVNIIIGDSDGTGAVDSLDLIIITRYCSGWSGLSANIENMDADRNGAVNGVDIILITRYIAGWYGDTSTVSFSTAMESVYPK